MLYVVPVQDKLMLNIPENYASLDLIEKLYIQRSVIPAVTHVDYSARIQTVNKITNPKFYTLIRAFKELTGTALIINTSFNVRGEPIVCSPLDAYRCFMNTDMDILVMGNLLFEKAEQPVVLSLTEFEPD